MNCEDCGQTLEPYEEKYRWCLPCYDENHGREEALREEYVLDKDEVKK